MFWWITKPRLRRQKFPGTASCRISKKRTPGSRDKDWCPPVVDIRLQEVINVGGSWRNRRDRGEVSVNGGSIADWTQWTSFTDVFPEK